MISKFARNLFACALLALALPLLASPPASAFGERPGANNGTAHEGAHEWPYWRGPHHDGTTDATGLPESWSPQGDNLAWSAPYGGRSAPVVFGDRLYLQNSVGDGPEQMERIVALDADTGDLLWEHRFNVALSDAPPHRVGWSSPTVDPATGNVYALGVDATFFGLSPDGELLWERFLMEDAGAISTHGGRTPSPIVVDDLVIVSAVTSGWGGLARGSHRFVAVDKISGAIAWISSPGESPFDTTYSPPNLVEIDGREILLVGGGDGSALAIEAATGRPVWRYAMSKRGVNSGILLVGDTAVVTHGEENLGSSVMGRVAAVNALSVGEIEDADALWINDGLLAGFSSPVTDGELVYQIDNAANLMGLDVNTGEVLWTEGLGTIQRASPVLADGKLYVGTANGEFFILRPSREGVEILDRDDLAEGDELAEIIGSAAVAHGRVYFPSMERLYAIGPAGDLALPAELRPRPRSSGEGAVATLIVHPQELVLEPGESVQFEARLFDERGRYLRSERAGASWSVGGPVGTIGPDGAFAAADGGPMAGSVTATVDGVEGSARLRVIPPLPWSFDFDRMEAVPPFWISSLGKFALAEDGAGQVLVKTNDNPFLRRTKVYLGGSDLSEYTIEVDFKTDMQSRRLGDAGLIAQRYSLILFGTKRSLELQPWQPETARTVTVPFAAQPDVWYRMKLRTINLEDGSVRVQGKLWERDDEEPAEWMVELVDDHGNRRGSPGLYADAHAVIQFDNLTVEPNQ